MFVEHLGGRTDAMKIMMMMMAMVSRLALTISRETKRTTYKHKVPGGNVRKKWSIIYIYI